MIVQQLVDHLPELAPEWRFLFLRSAEWLDRLSDAPNVEELVLQPPANGPASMWFMPQLVDFGHLDLFHAPSNILPAGIPVPTVTTIHDLMWLDSPELCNPQAWGRVERLFYQNGIRRALKSSDAIISVSEATRDRIAAHDSTAAARTSAILPGVSPAFQPRTARREHLATLGVPQGRYMLTVGQNAPYKNHAGAIRGFAAAAGEIGDLDLVIVQRRGPGNDELKQLSRAAGAEGRVHFVEPVEDEVLVELYCGATALLHPSLCEGFGMPIAEAMACGCPVITSDRAAMPEVAAGAALLVDPLDPGSIASAIQRLASEAPLAGKLRDRGLKRASELSWKAFAMRHVEVYSAVLGTEGTASRR